MTTSEPHDHATRLLADARALFEQATMERGRRRRDHFIATARLVCALDGAAPSDWQAEWKNLSGVHFVSQAIRALTGWCPHCLALHPAQPKHAPKRPMTWRKWAQQEPLTPPTERAVRRTTWHRRLAEADALLAEAAQLAGRARRTRLVAAARLIDQAGNIPIPRDLAMYGAWKHAVRATEEAVFRATGEYPSFLALTPRERRRIDREIVAGRRDIAAGRSSGPFDAEELIAHLHEGAAKARKRVRR